MIIGKAMLLRIEMDAVYRSGEVLVGIHFDPAEILLEQGSCPAVHFIDRFRVRVEQIGECAGGVFHHFGVMFNTLQVFKTWKVFQIFNFNKMMKRISH